MNQSDNIVQSPETRVAEILQQLGVPTSKKGYDYLQTAILMVQRDYELIYEMDRILYPSVAKKYSTTTSRVKSAIRRAIEISSDRGDLDILSEYFGCTIDGKPSNSEFIATIAEAIRVQIKCDNNPLETNVTKIFKLLGVPANIKGYDYLRTAILMAHSDFDIVNQMTRVLYPSIAKKYSTTTSRVESAIRRAIEISWDRGNVQYLSTLFGNTKPKNRQFIITVVDELKKSL